jgi:hypothetical protein
LLSAEPNIQFTFTKEFKKGGLLDKKRGWQVEDWGV